MRWRRNKPPRKASKPNGSGVEDCAKLTCEGGRGGEMGSKDKSRVIPFFLCC